jgi:hypothetical protein
MHLRSVKKPKLLPRKQINVKTLGLLHTMHWNEHKIPTPAQGEILVEAKAAGINFKVRVTLLHSRIECLEAILIWLLLIGSHDFPWSYE